MLNLELRAKTTGRVLRSASKSKRTSLGQVASMLRCISFLVCFGYRFALGGEGQELPETMARFQGNDFVHTFSGEYRISSVSFIC